MGPDSEVDERVFLTDALREFDRLRRLAEEALARMDDRTFLREPHPGGNSAAVLVKHLAGNIRSRFLGFPDVDGERPDRNREGEFEIGADDSRESLMDGWAAAHGIRDDALRGLAERGLGAGEKVTIRGETMTVRQAVLRNLLHLSYHVGQIVHLAKAEAEEGWVSLSIPPGGSDEARRTGGRYLER